MIEAEFDRALMAEDGYDPLRYRPIHHLWPTHFHAHIISFFFPTVTKRQVRSSLRSMRFCLKFLAPRGPKARRFLLRLMDAVHCPKGIHDMVIAPEPAEGIEPVCEDMKKRYREAVPLAVRLIENYRSYMEGLTPLDPYLERTFGEE